MAFSTIFKNVFNAALAPAGLRLITLTKEKQELARLAALRQAGQFDRAVFPVPRCVENSTAQVVFDHLQQHQARFDSFQDAARNDVGYAYANDYFTSPDTEVLYTLVRHFKPGRVIEIGSGNSTRVTRQAIKDGKLATQLVSIDPWPRRAVVEFCDETLREPVEAGGAQAQLQGLRSGDFLFIDSSHEVKTGNDVVFLLLNLLPQLPAGVFVHVHDILLPYDYRPEWSYDYNWSEQYLMQAILAFGDTFEVVWPGHYLQRTRTDFAAHFPHLAGREAYSLWLRKVK